MEWSFKLPMHYKLQVIQCNIHDFLSQPLFLNSILSCYYESNITEIYVWYNKESLTERFPLAMSFPRTRGLSSVL